MDLPPPQRVIAYIDGFNLYFGLRAADLRRYYWLDFTALARNLLKPYQTLVYTRYFTARIAGPTPLDAPAKAKNLSEKRQRQVTFLDALTTLPDLEITEGHYLPKPKFCRQCGATWTQHEEKMTDVNIATAMLVDAFQDVFDVALVISGDSDLAPPIFAIRQFFPEKRVIVAFPPRRHSIQLRRAAHGSLAIGHDKLRNSLLPEEVTLGSGAILRRPAHWR